MSQCIIFYLLNFTKYYYVGLTYRIGYEKKNDRNLIIVTVLLFAVEHRVMKK